MKNFGLIIALIVIGFIGGVVYLSSNRVDSNIEISATQQEILTIDEDDHVYGNKDAGVVLFEYFDFECPACAAYHPLIKEALETHGEDFAYVPRYFPLHFHPNGLNASLAVEAAALQGKNREMTDRLFEAQKEWSGQPSDIEVFVPYAMELGLDVDKWRVDVNSDEVALLVNTDLAEGREIGVNGTPTFFLGGVKISNPKTPDELRALIESVGESTETEGEDGPIEE